MAAPSQYDRAGFAVGLQCFQTGDKTRPKRFIYGVPLFRPIQPECSNTIASLDRNRFAGKVFDGTHIVPLSIRTPHSSVGEAKNANYAFRSNCFVAIFLQIAYVGCTLGRAAICSKNPTSKGQRETSGTPATSSI